MGRLGLTWYVFIPGMLAGAVLVLLLAAAIPESYLLELEKDQLLARAERIAATIPENFQESDTDTSGELSDSQLAKLCGQLGGLEPDRLAVIAAGGKVLCDTRPGGYTPLDASPADRPETAHVLANGTGTGTADISRQSGKKLGIITVAVPIASDRGSAIRSSFRPFAGVLYLQSESDASVASYTANARYRLMLVAGLSVLVFVAAALVVSRLIRSRIDELEKSARKTLAGQDWQGSAMQDIPEIARLAESVSGLAVRLTSESKTAGLRQEEQATFLSSMAEGVIAVDEELRVITLNTAAMKLFKLDPAMRYEGLSIQETIRNPDIHKIIRKAQDSKAPVEAEIFIYDPAETRLHLHGTRLLRSGRGLTAEHEVSRKTGVVIVCHDITRLKRLEEVRRDFAANVSHEIRTPLTAIKGYIETLIDDDRMTKVQMREFHEIISRHAARLESIIADLMTLARIESDDEKGSIDLDEAAIFDAVKNSAMQHKAQADEKQLQLNIEGDAAITASINRPLLEEAVFNLVDNAIKYTGRCGTVDVKVEQSGHPRTALACELHGDPGEPGLPGTPEKWVKIAVRDTGVGIEKKHHPRLFERFYRVDKGRSRKEGGTGLGLAIVKHIAQAHGGVVAVESVPGGGSAFYIFIPMTKKAGA